jgi:hypothetical protein
MRHGFMYLVTREEVNSHHAKVDIRALLGSTARGPNITLADLYQAAPLVQQRQSSRDKTW